jgi:prepilin-type N-terminal cleavage/methylation domain-containing protein
MQEYEVMKNHPPFAKGASSMNEQLPEQKKPCRENGFSLMEVMIAIAILSIGMLSVGVMQTAAMRGNATSRSITEASVRASNLIEMLMTLDPTGTPAENPLITDRTGNGKAGLGYVGVGTSDWNRTDGRYSIFWNIAKGDIAAGTRTVAVIVQWKDRGLKPRHVVMEGVLPF